MAVARCHKDPLMRMQSDSNNTVDSMSSEVTGMGLQSQTEATVRQASLDPRDMS